MLVTDWASDTECLCVLLELVFLFLEHCIVEVLNCNAEYSQRAVPGKGWMVKCHPTKKSIELLMTCNSSEGQNCGKEERARSWILNVDTPDKRHEEIPFQVYAMMRNPERWDLKWKNNLCFVLLLMVFCYLQL